MQLYVHFLAMVAVRRDNAWVQRVSCSHPLAKVIFQIPYLVKFGRKFCYLEWRNYGAENSRSPAHAKPLSAANAGHHFTANVGSNGRWRSLGGYCDGAGQLEVGLH